MTPVLLWTDALVFLLVACGIASGIYISRREYLLASWHRVGESRAGMASLTLLVAFVVVGLIDSLHYRPRLEAASGQPGGYSGEVRSLLDVLLQPLRDGTEKTYSAPLAAHLYARETVELPDGSQARVFPRLKHGGAHLADVEAEWGRDVTLRTLRGAALAVLAGLTFVALAVLFAARRWGTGWQAAWRRIRRGETRFAWHAALAALGMLLLLAGPALSLAGGYHVLGTDKVGQDVLYLTLKSIRTGLVIGTLTTLVMLPFAVALGLVAGYVGGWVDDLIQYLYTTLNSIPGVLLIAAAVLMVQVAIDMHPDWFATAAQRADARLLALCLILGVTSWTGLCRLLRAETLKLRELEYVQAAQAFGASAARILGRHILPNVMHIVLISVVMDFSGLVLAEAVLSYIGIGVDPSTISFGTMINTARLELAREPVVWWSLLAAFVFMFVLVLAANLFADAVRDAFDPRLAGSRRSLPGKMA
ncbi:MAG: peptide ABC transporter permease [Rhodocyclaceae bacterium]|uniref:Peptide ABC transporter permease n=1 Tax=Candidatus Desulfobacillus denitrificans TaxID=2608985 RepID=A0A809RXF6_9PROT|nr:MAG: peptide ABC transporter permease [Rhodocyclaceae bacterium UTPRO2]BBO21037.1 peptide ABC transporter permease [Candidatus Desulfobacillus denitrificans]GIK45303.1 MAG: peptide ABC transporter permease [Betaproteobacteria bacterium]GJQ53617.1 MAG: peptide ABC transporter permease [Rhodocyclaceae bacterium]